MTVRPPGSGGPSDLPGLTTVLNNSLDAALILNADLVVQYINPAAVELYGRSADEQIGRPVGEAVTYRWPEGITEETVAETLLRDGTWSGETIVERPDGSQRTVQTSSVLIYASDGSLRYIVSISRDVTERRRLEDTLREMQSRFRNLVEQTPGVTYIDSALDGGRWVYLSPQVEELTGYPPEAWLEHEDLWGQVLLHPDDRAEMEALDRETNRTGGAWDVDYRIVTKEGRTVWVHDVASVIRSEAGLPAYWQGTMTDITARKEAEGHLRFLVSVLESVNDAIISVDLDMCLTSWNRSAEESFGWSADEVIGRPIREVLRTELVGEEASEDLLRLAEIGQWRGQLKQHHRTGKPLYIEARGMPVLDAQGAISGYVSVNRDVTEQRRAEEIAREAWASEEAAERANRTKTEFLSRMSHELRTPLNAILGFSQLLSLDDLSEQQRASVDHIRRGGDHLLALIDEVLELSRMDSKEVELTLESVDLNESLASAADLVVLMAEEAAVTVELPPVPAREAAWARADPQRLQQVFVNLLSNAIKYNEAGGSVSISIRGPSNDHAGISISFQDTGRGIAPEALERVFDPFERLGAETTEIQGTGLGLSLSRRLVKAMGGSLSAESDGRHGSTFTVKLEPASAPTSRALTPAPVPTEPEADATEGAILYIEDNLSNLRLVERVVALRPGIELVTAMQGQVGLDIARARVPDLILLDLHLPDIQGPEVLRALREDPRTTSIPVVAISADATPVQIARIHAAGVDEYLTKPVDVSRLLSLIDRMLPREATR